MKTLALEAIAFQGTAFFEALTEAFARLRVAARKREGTSPSTLKEGKALREVIRQHTNLSVTLMPQQEDVTAGILCPRLSNGHVFDSVFGWNDATDSSWNADAHTLLKKYKDGFAKGMVDIRQNRVDGIFAEIPYQLYLRDAFILGELMTEQELAAVVLHEIGHAFTQCEYINRTVATNQVLADILNAKNAGQESKISTIIVRLASEEQLTAKQKDALLACKKPQDYVITAYAVADERCRSELGYSVYESTSCEQLADLYATRCGAGRHIVTALHKLNQVVFGGYENKSKLARVAASLFSFLLCTTYMGLLTGASWGIITTPAIGLIIGIGVGVLFTAMVFKGGLNRLDYALYDDTVARFDRIKHQLVQQLKDWSLSRKLTASVLADIEEIDKIIEPLRATDEGAREGELSHYLALFFSSTYRKKYDIELLQKQLEALASNNLFVQAAKLKTV